MCMGLTNETLEVDLGTHPLWEKGRGRAMGVVTG